MAKLGPVTDIVVHHTASPLRTTMADIRKWHVEERGWPDIGYHFVILGNGKLCQARDLGTRGAHAPPNKGRIGVCVVGDNTKERSRWRPGQIEKLREVIAALTVLYPDAKVSGHREIMAPGHTTCPGVEVSLLLTGVV